MERKKEKNTNTPNLLLQLYQVCMYDRYVNRLLDGEKRKEKSHPEEGGLFSFFVSNARWKRGGRNKVKHTLLQKK